MYLVHSNISQQQILDAIEINAAANNSTYDIKAKHYKTYNFVRECNLNLKDYLSVEREDGVFIKR